MAVPTITSVSPTSGHTGGRSLVEILGTNFSLPDAGSVEVLFGGKSALRVDVAASDRLFAVAPIQDPGASSVLVRNLDTNGDPVAGEEVTLADGYTFIRPVLTSESLNELDAANRAIITELRRQITPNVSISTNADYESEGGIAVHVTELARLPGIVLIGPGLVENRFYSTNEEYDEDDELLTDENGSIEFNSDGAPYTVDVLYTVIGFADLKQVLVNLQQAMIAFFRKNKLIEITCGAQTESFELEIPDGGEFVPVGTPNNSNLYSFQGQILIRGFDLFTFPGIDREFTSRGAYTDEQGAEINLTQKNEGPQLVVRSILSPGDC